MPSLRDATRTAGYAYANRSFDTLEDLEEVLFQRCKVLLEQQFLIRAITYYHWWPLTAC